MSSASTPIIIDLTETENRGHELAGNAPDEGIETQIELVLSAKGGMDRETIVFLAGKLAKGAHAARAKIREATRYEIRVVTPPKPSTLLPTAKKANQPKNPK